MLASPEKQQAVRPLAALAAQGWPEAALKREAALIAAYPTSRAQFTLLLAAIRGE
jgi:hypothetical protein